MHAYVYINIGRGGIPQLPINYRDVEEEEGLWTIGNAEKDKRFFFSTSRSERSAMAYPQRGNTTWGCHTRDLWFHSMWTLYVEVLFSPAAEPSFFWFFVKHNQSNHDQNKQRSLFKEDKKTKTIFQCQRTLRITVQTISFQSPKWVASSKRASLKSWVYLV